jgi:Zn-dependent peptidase ImmA (M78 family)
LQLWMGEENQYSLPAVHSLEQPESVAEALRASLGLTLDEQAACKSKHKAYQLWRLRVEDRGVYVLEGNFPSAECRGFSVYDDRAPVIAVTNEDYAAPRTFSLLHELTHLSLRVSGLCEVEAPWDVSAPSIEVFCNHVAGAVLVPFDSLLALEAVSGHSGPDWTDESLEQIAGSYHVSKEVLLRRLLLAGRTDSVVYERKRQEWASAHEDMPTFIPRVTQSRRAFNRNGVRFSSLVIAAEHAGMVTPIEAASFLSTKPKHLGAIERMVIERRAGG